METLNQQSVIGIAELLVAVTIPIGVAIYAGSKAIHGLRQELKHSIQLTRYEIVRRKRAIAKALLEEIIEIRETHTDENQKAKLAVYPSVVAEIGRLDTESIRAIMRFYGAYDRGSTDVELALKAEDCLKAFLEGKTKNERDYLSSIFKIYDGTVSEE